jgi:predicted transglutaminase-like protease
MKHVEINDITIDLNTMSIDDIKDMLEGLKLKHYKDNTTPEEYKLLNECKMFKTEERKSNNIVRLINMPLYIDMDIDTDINEIIYVEFRGIPSSLVIDDRCNDSCDDIHLKVMMNAVDMYNNLYEDDKVSVSFITTPSDMSRVYRVIIMDKENYRLI